jgi:hypothetical protein
MEYLKDKINEFKIYNKTKNITNWYRGIKKLKAVTNLEMTW